MTLPVPDRDPLTSPQHDSSAQVNLRILATTDVHMRLSGFDYVADTDHTPCGLAGLGTLITQARLEAKSQKRACILVDNGDMFQGTPLGDYVARQPVGPTHPAVACINHLQYDAVGVGNHDLDFGVPYLTQVAAHLDAPVISSNLTVQDSAQKQLGTPLRTSAIVSCALPETDSVLKIGILSVLPKLTEVWNRDWLCGLATLTPAAQALPPAIADLRAQGADLVILLAHMGIAPDQSGDDETALSLAQISGVDAIITGHTHRRFPGRDHRHGGGVDTAQGRLHAVPAIMAGHGGSDLGILDLTLTRHAADGWQVSGHTATLVGNQPDTPPLPALLSATQSAHETVRRHLTHPLGWTDQHLHNYFALAAPTATCAFLASAKEMFVRNAIVNTPDADLPVLVSTAAHTAGGRDGPEHYLSIPRGDVLRRHLAGLNPFNNQTVVLRITGAELRRWLEHSATVFTHLTEDRSGMMLKRADTPAFNFETVYGVTYTLDPTQPAGNRVGNLLHHGAPVRVDDMFLLVTNQFRAAGGGGFDVFAPDRVALRLAGSTEDMLAEVLADNQSYETADTDAPWSFATLSPVEAELQTSPAATAFLDEVSHLAPQVLGHTQDGFLRLGLTL